MFQGPHYMLNVTMLPFPHKSLWMHLSVAPMKITEYKHKWNAENCKETIINFWRNPYGKMKTKTKKTRERSF